MDHSEILDQLDVVFIDVLDNKDIKLNYSTTADDVEDWDSLNHIQLVVAIEKKFKIRFSSKEIQNWKNVGELVESINSKMLQA